MTKSRHSELAKIVADNCGFLACISIGFAILVIVFSFMVSVYQVEVWAAVSIMVGIAFAGLLTRLRLFLSYCQDSEPDEMFNPIVKYLIVFSLLGLAAGVGMAIIYNETYTVETLGGISCVDPDNDEEIPSKCDEYRYSVQQLLDYGLIAVPLYIVFLFAITIKLGVSRFNRNEQADNK